MTRIKFFLLLFFIAFFAKAQEEKTFLKSGNKKYAKSLYAEAELEYLKALQKKQNYLKADYNLGNSRYKQSKYADAKSSFESVISSTKDKDTLFRAFHNLGTTLLKDKSYSESVKAFKNALKINPKDEDTRYNLAFAQKKLKEQQKKQEEEDKKNKEKKEEENKNNGNNKDEKKEMNNDKQPSPPSQALSKAEAQRMLDALKNDEKNMKALKKAKGDKKGQRVKPEKDW